MNDLKTFYSENLIENRENLYLYFWLGSNRYGLNISQVVEIIKLPALDYPQKLPNNVVGLLNYNNFTINILDLRFYLNIKVSPYSVSNQLLIVKTDEALFGLIIDKVENIIALDSSKVEYFSSQDDSKILEFMYKEENGTISIVNLTSLENIIKNGISEVEIDIPSLFPSDDDSRYKLIRRSQSLAEKFNLNFAPDLFSHDKFISFLLDNQTYCLNIESIKEFLKDVSITNLPCGYSYIEGIIALKGDFVVIMNLKEFLGISGHTTKTTESSEKNNIIIVDGPDFKLGLLVDEILSIVSLPEELIRRNQNNQNKYILSEAVLDDNLYTILDLQNIFSDERLYIEQN